MKKRVLKKYNNYKKNKGKLIYINARRNKKIKKGNILFEAVHGDTYSGHIYYMIKELLNNSKLNFKIYVSLKDTEDIELLFDKSELKRINFVKHMSNQYYELMATCEYLINDTTFYPFFNKREGQKYYIIWHGTPLKHMGKDIPKVVDIANVQRNFYMADRIYVNNQKTMEILARTHHLNNVYNGKFIVGPSPRNSVFFDEEKRNQNRNDFNLNNKKMLAYMPTWRGNIGSVQNSQHVTKLITYFEENLDENTVLYVKLHPFEKTIIPDSYEKVKPFPSNIETYEFLAVTDCLITDYSSVMYDYVNLGKPVILYTYDYKDYKENRGLYDDLSLYPFIQSNSLEGLLKQVEQIPQQIDYQEFKNEYNKYDKIDAPKIIINHMFLDKDDLTIEEHNLHNGKETVVIVSGGFWSNGITTALINTLENIDTTEKNYICFFEKDKVKKEHYYRLLDLPENVHFYPTVGEINGSIKDRLLMKRYLWNEKFKIKGMEKDLSRIFKEEFSRLFGDLKIDWFIHYTGFERKSAEMMRHIDTNTAIWVHTDMFAEYEAKKNFSKKIIYGAYEKANKIVLVHRNLKANLINHLPQVSNKIVTVNNFLGEQRTRKLAKENLLESIDNVHVDYAYNENMYLDFANLDQEQLDDKIIQDYPEQTVLTENITESIKQLETKEEHSKSTLVTQKDKIEKSIVNSITGLYEDFLKDRELTETFKHLFVNNQDVIDEYFNLNEKDPIVNSVELYNQMRVSKCRMLDALYNPEIKVYMNIGRYDYQKGHDKLIAAFEKVYIENPNVFLIMVCPHGPLKSQTIQWVRDSVAKENIVILGGINNPYPLLDHVDAFVLSSNYEGLGLVVYEALALNTDVITVNLKETTEYLNENQAIITENSVEGLVDGLMIHLEGNKSFEEFDFNYYKEKSKQEFINVFK